MTEIAVLKSARANYIFISDNGFIKRNGYLFLQRRHSDYFYQLADKQWNIYAVSWLS